MTATDEARRQQNRELIAKFLSGVDRDVDEFFTDDAVKEITFATFFSPDCEPMRWVGKEEIRKNAAANEERLVSYEWKDVRIFATEDPDTFWVEASGEGVMRIEGFTGPTERPYVQKDYFLCFELRDGKIARYREIMNPLELLTTVGGRIDLPPLPPQTY